MFENTEGKSLIGTIGLVVVVALITAFVVAWTQRLIMDKTYVAVTVALTLVATYVVISMRHLRRAR